MSAKLVTYNSQNYVSTLGSGLYMELMLEMHDLSLKPNKYFHIIPTRLTQSYLVVVIVTIFSGVIITILNILSIAYKMLGLVSRTLNLC